MARPRKVPHWDDLPPTLDMRMAAQLLGIGVDLCYRLAKQGQIPILRFGRIYKVPTQALRRLVEQGYQDSAAIVR